MRNVPVAMTDRWKAQAKTGTQRPAVRATIQKVSLHKVDYDTSMAAGEDFGHQRHRVGIFTSIIFGDASPAREIPNIKSCTWSRSVEQDVATCTLTLTNSQIDALGADDAGDFDQPGFYSYKRENSAWAEFFVPDRLVKTYEGYGMDDTVAPGLDANLLQSGTWLIDKVRYTAEGDIVLEMRDVGRLLLDQIVFPPVVPYSEYPLEWEVIHNAQVPARDCKGGSWGDASGSASSSNELYIGKGLTNPPVGEYVGPNGGVNGHHADHALENNENAWWWSTGQENPTDKVWWQVDLSSPVDLAGIRLQPYGGPYRIYISIKTAAGWVGKRKIPYTVTTGGVNIKANIPFVRTDLINRLQPFEIVLNRKYRGVKAIRITFTAAYERVGLYPWHAGLRDIQLYTGSYDSLSFGEGTVSKTLGNYRDYGDIVKWCTAWGGWFWPPHATGKDFFMVNAADKQFITYASDDPVLPKGRVWGDFMNSTYGSTTLTMDLFDKKPLMDVINYCRDATGHLFFIDETGGVVWRMPNLWKLGNYLSPAQMGQRTRSRTSDHVVLNENETLLSYETILDSSDLRERIFVANTTGKIGVVVRGFRPIFTDHGFRRIAGWTDQRFGDKVETRIAADIIAAKQMFTYRRGKATIPGYPAVQVDDQVRINESVTSETYFHYVLGINSTLDMDEGTWFYDLDTHWLGENPAGEWVVKQTELAPMTQAYLNTMD